MIAKLRSLLAECHITGDIVRTLATADYFYLVQRAQEEMDYAKQEMANNPKAIVECNRRLIFATRLITIARLKLENPDVSDTTHKRKSRSSRRAGLPDVNVDN